LREDYWTMDCRTVSSAVKENRKEETQQNLIVNRVKKRKETKDVRIIERCDGCGHPCDFFSVKPKDWLAWIEKFLAKACQKELKEIYQLDTSKLSQAIGITFSFVYPTLF
jgi:heterodisulfide reductase subunit B